MVGGHGRGRVPRSGHGSRRRGIAAASVAATSRRVGGRDVERGVVAAASVAAGSAAAARRRDGGWARPRPRPAEWPRIAASRHRGGERRGDVAASGGSRR